MSDQFIDGKRELLSALKRQQQLKLRHCFDPSAPDSRPTPKQLEVLTDTKDVLFQYFKGGNQSGKTATGARIVAWLLQGAHPYWDFKKEWPDEPLLMILVGRLGNHVEEIWERKIKPFLQAGEWRENRQGGTLQWVVNPINKHKIVFATHNNPVEAREKLQMYSAHFVWLDELTDHLGIIEELQRRVQAKRGRMLLTFTPKIRAEAVRKFLETPTPYSKIYSISMLENPVYEGRREELLSQIMQLPKAQQETVLYGEWYVGEKQVFSFDPSRHVASPPGYSVLWPHIPMVDPAASGLMGYTLWAGAYPNAHTWWCVKSEYIKGAAPSDLVELVEEKVKHLPQILFKGFDSHEAWYGKTAIKMGVKDYRGVQNKHSRKSELIANFNGALINGRVRITPEAPDIIAELTTCQWSEAVEGKIISASSYHLADTAQYFVDMMPVYKAGEPMNQSYDQQLWQANQARRKLEQTRAQGMAKKPRIYARRSNVWTRSA